MIQTIHKTLSPTLHTMKTLVFALAMFFCVVTQLQASLGKSIDECAALYGSGEVKNYVAPHHKTILYSRWFSDTVTVDFYDGIATTVYYHVGSAKPEDKKIQRYLQMNAQGHKWTLKSQSSYGSASAEWERDDGATASFMAGFSMFLSISAPPKAKSFFGWW
jgi:hypothetical protein